MKCNMEDNMIKKAYSYKSYFSLSFTASHRVLAAFADNLSIT